jgi:hypothetical protein
MQKTVKHGDEFGHFSTVPSFVDILDDHPPNALGAPRERCASRKLDPHVLVMQATQEGARQYVANETVAQRAVTAFEPASLLTRSH